MGIYLNPDNDDFNRALRSPIYVDKSELIKYTDSVLNTEQQYLCVSRPRRFGKSMAANMLTAYYSRGCDSEKMFSGLKIAKDPCFKEHLNKYNVIRINIASFVSRAESAEGLLKYLSSRLIKELKNEFGDAESYEHDDLVSVLEDIYAANKTQFIFIIDEWDCILRSDEFDEKAEEKYLDFLKALLKDQCYVALAYMTGILPVKKYGDDSALNMFTEISMTLSFPLTEFMGFTDDEVTAECGKFNADIEEIRHWYNGYNADGISLYNPQSVVYALIRHKCRNYWNATKSYESLKKYINMNFDGLRDKISEMIGGAEINVNIEKFRNDIKCFNSADDVLTLLVHLGYLTYYEGRVRIPNSEVRQEFINSIEDGGWENIMQSIKASDELIEATLAGDEKKVAEMVRIAHDDNTSVLKYNDENSLSCVISLAYYAARRDYIICREFPAGKGFADMVFIPLKRTYKPAMVIELKSSRSASAAIEQIKKKEYSRKIAEYSGDIVLVGINYDKDSKEHTCKIEMVRK